MFPGAPLIASFVITGEPGHQLLLSSKGKGVHFLQERFRFRTPQCGSQFIMMINENRATFSDLMPEAEIGLRFHRVQFPLPGDIGLFLE